MTWNQGAEIRIRQVIQSCALLFVCFLLHGCAKPTPKFPNAEVCFSDGRGHNLAYCGLRGSANKPKVTKGGRAVAVEWTFLDTDPTGDLYEFSITEDAATPRKTKVRFTGSPVELDRSGDIVVTVRQIDPEASPEKD